MKAKVKSVMPVSITDFFSYFWHFHIDILFMKEGNDYLPNTYFTGLSQAQKGVLYGKERCKSRIYQNSRLC